MKTLYSYFLGWHKVAQKGYKINKKEWLSVD